MALKSNPTEAGKSMNAPPPKSAGVIYNSLLKSIGFSLQRMSLIIPPKLALMAPNRIETSG